MTWKFSLATVKGRPAMWTRSWGRAGPDVPRPINWRRYPRLSRQVRVQASYPRSYAVLAHAKRRGAVVKPASCSAWASGWMGPRGSCVSLAG